MPTARTQRRPLTVGQAATQLGVAKRTVLHMIAHDRLKAEKLDPDRLTSAWLIDADDVDRAKRERAEAPIKQPR